MGWMIKDFKCSDCNHEWEELYREGEGVDCPMCGSSNTQALISTPGLGTYSMLDREGKAAHLKKRSYEHGMKNKKRMLESALDRMKNKKK